MADDEVWAYRFVRGADGRFPPQLKARMAFWQCPICDHKRTLGEHSDEEFQMCMSRICEKPPKDEK